ncbi:hypothetical protein [Caudoviricetes sp.]|nr:hypothetical protein [Caudoviricetes sp.]
MSTVTTPKFRVSYPAVFKARTNDLNGKDEYGLVALFPKDADLSVLKAAAQEAIEKKWGKDKSKWPSNRRNPFRDQKEKEKDGRLPLGHEEGAIFINLKSQQRPGVVDQSLSPILDELEFYSGCWARASVRAYAYDQKGNKGVSFGLINVQKVSDGDPLGGRSRPEDDFTPIKNESGTTPTNTDDLFN